MRAAATVAGRLAAFAVETPGLPAEVAARARVHLLDTVGCGLAALGSGAGDPASAVVVEQGGSEQASILGEARRLPVGAAALANGTRFHALDFDDTHDAGICHASAAVAPAALAVGEARASTGAAVLDAYGLGCEVATRVGVATADHLYQRGFHPTGVCGAFGATAAAARLEGLDPVATARAFGIVGSFAGGLLEYLSDGSATKPLHAGWAAQAGIQAARLAGAGATGPVTIFEGPMGLIASHAEGADPDKICEELGERWEVAAMSLKPYPACHFAHSSTWAAAALVEELGIAVDEIEAIVVRIPAEGRQMVLDPIERRSRPVTPYDAKFSLPYTVAHRLLRGRLDLDSFSSAAVADPEVLALAARVSAEPIDAADGAHSRFAGGARIVERGGRESDRFLAHAPGSPRNPLPEAFVAEKFRANALLALAAGEAERLEQELRSIDAAPTLEPLGALLRGAARAEADGSA